MIRIRYHLASIILVCVLGGYIVEFVLSKQHYTIRKASEVHNNHGLLVKDFESLLADVSQFLISADLVLGSDQTYLVSGTLKKGDSISADIERMVVRLPNGSQRRQLRQVFEHLHEAKMLVKKSQGISYEARLEQLSNLLGRYDEVSQTLVQDIESVLFGLSILRDKSELSVQTMVSENEKATVLFRVVYGVVILFVWLWSNAHISRPIRYLSRAAQTMSSSDTARLRLEGPKEILELGARLESMATELLYQARHDPLTGLYNRREFARKLSEKFSELNSSDDHQRLLCFIDLDRFKNVNDSCGHAAGDELLKIVAKNISAHAGEHSIVARLGGDEFAILLEESEREQGIQVATAILNSIRAIRFEWEESVYRISASIGVTLISDRGASITDWLNAADSACFSAKELGRDKIQLFEINDDRLVNKKSETKVYNEVIHALEHDRLVLYRQDIVPLQDRRAGGDYFEVLVRMLSSDDRIIEPGAFLGVVERYQLAERLDRWVVNATLGFFEAHAYESDCLDTVSINLSGQSLASVKMREFLVERVTSSTLPADKICFEITETAAINDMQEARELIRIVGGLGCRFALDDFGSGLSSFAYLQQLNVNIIKIDGAFIRDIENDALNEIMVRCMNEISQTANIKTVAEYVENIEIVERLTAMGVDYAQGYYFSKPQRLSAQQPVDRLKSASR